MALARPRPPVYVHSVFIYLQYSAWVRVGAFSFEEWELENIEIIGLIDFYFEIQKIKLKHKAFLLSVKE